MNIFSKLYSFLVNRKLFFYSLLSILIFVFIFFGIKLKLNNDIYTVFPQNKEFKKINTWLKNSNFSRQVVFSIDFNNKYDADSILNSIADNIEKNTKNLLNNFQIYSGNNSTFLIDFWQKNNPIFWQKNDYHCLEKKLSPDSINLALSSIKGKLVGVQAVFLQKFISTDPLSWYWNKIQSFQTTNKNSDYNVEDGIIFQHYKKRILFFADITFDSNNKSKASLLRKKLDDLKLKNKNWDYFGTFLIANENARQIEKDNFLTLIISISLILVILITYYRNIFIPLLFLIGPIFGALLGVFMLYSFKKEVSSLSLSVSAILFGIVLDYSFHFFTHLKHCSSIERTVKEIVFPMFVGSFTTIAAFWALCFTSSIFLQELGFFAVFCLSGTALFNVIFLPVILTHLRFEFKSKDSALDRFLDSFTKLKIGKKIIFPLSVLFFIALFINSPSFDGDLNHLSYHTDELKIKEEKFTGLNPSKHKKIFILSENKNLDSAINSNYLVYNLLQENKEKLKIDEIVSLAPFYFSKNQIDSAKINWKNFWNDKKEVFWKNFKQIANIQGFDTNYFKPFHKQIFSPNFSSSKINKDILNEMRLSNFIIKSINSNSFITSVSLDKNNVVNLKNKIRKINNVSVIDRSDFSSNLLNSVQADFSYLFYFASIMVFLSLLIVYGRIELAIFTFLPMIISWVLILALMSILNIQFNFVNILICTIIFGLGDDYSIFVTDGLLQKYKINSKVLNSYQSAIFLSVLSTLIGTAVFFLAKHPSINSIALISVLGLTIIYLISILVQPLLFYLWLGKRKEELQAPATFFVSVFTVILYLYFISGCLFFYPFLLIVSVLPIHSLSKKKIINYTISKLAKSVIYFGFHIKKSVKGNENMDLSKPCIFIANHASFLDILLILMLSPKIIIMVKKWVYYSPLFGVLVRKAGYIYAKEGSELHLKLIEQNFKEGYSIMIFPEGTRSVSGELGRFHKGAFYLSEQLKCAIQPILIQGSYDVVSKKDMLIKSGELNLKILPRIEYNESNFSPPLRERSKEISNYFKKEFILFEKEKKDVDYLFTNVLRSYLFKGPILEWYVRIKWKLEKSNYEFYNKIIGDRKSILDFGCGYGFLDLFLHYSDSSKKITAIDYDEEKIDVAKNIYNKNENLNFICSNDFFVKDFKYDVFLFLDVLHYLPENKQCELLNKAINSLNKNGIILIRDGIKDESLKHKNTERTEFLSTKVFSFNKKSSQFNFFTKDFIYNLANENSLHIVMINHSRKTSNVLFILKNE